MSTLVQFVHKCNSQGYLRTIEAALEWRIAQHLPLGGRWDNYHAFLMFKVFHGRVPDPGAQTFSDYLYSLKINGELEDPLRVFITDKEYVKLFIKSVLGDSYNVPTIAVVNSVHILNSFEFPHRCCIKATHGSGHTVIRRHGEQIDFDKIRSWFDYNHYNTTRERNYRTLRPKIIVEPLLFDSDNIEDYKFFCWKGRPKLIQVDSNRYSDHRRDIFDIRWNKMPYSIAYPTSDEAIPPPKNLPHMLEVAEKLSSYFHSIRVDLYTNGNDIFVGELTNCHGSANKRFIPLSGEEHFSRIFFA